MITRTLLAGTAVLVLAGCAPQLDRIEQEMQQSTDEIANMRAEQQRMSQDMEAINSLLRMDSESGTETEAQRLARINQLSRKIDQLIQKLDDNAQYMRSLSARVELLASRAGIPMTGQSGWSGAADTSSAMMDLPEEGRAIFQAAQLDRSRGNVDLAQEGLQDFLTKYGSSELADDAVYWLGDIAYGEDDYSTALAQFQDLFDRFPNSEFIPAALLKSAYSLRSLGREIESREFLERLVEDYPDSPEAAQAKEQLKDSSG